MNSDHIHDFEFALIRWLLNSRSTAVETGRLIGIASKQQNLSQFALEGLADAFSLNEQIKSNLSDSLLVRLALHLCPPNAIHWDSSQPSSRVEEIKQYLQGDFNLSETEADKVSREVAVLLSSWEAKRKSLASKSSLILQKQNSRCNCCRITITRERIEKLERDRNQDLFRPYHLDPGVQTWMSPEVDHITPISSFGTNDDSNLQVLCKLCNSGKSDGTGISLSHEYKHSSSDVGRGSSNSLWQHIRQLGYYRMQMDDICCTKCTVEGKELTIRKVRENGALVLSNLQSLCRDCASSI